LMSARKIAHPDMESDVTQSALFYKLYVWGDKYRKQLLWGLIALVAAGVVIAFWLVRQSEKQNDANEALSKLTSRVSPTAPEATPESLLKVAADYPDTDAGQRALLLGASDLFTAGKYEEAMAQFQKFQRDNVDSPLTPQAAMGVAACYDAEGKTNDAVSAYQGIVDRYQNQNVFPQAKLALARLLEAQGKYKEAQAHLDEIVHTIPGTINTEAALRLQELSAAHPELQGTNGPAAAPMMPRVAH
jgi:TolA-binding protein